MRITLVRILIVGLSTVGFAQGTITVKNGALSSRNNYSTKTSFFNTFNGETIISNEDTYGSYFMFDEFKLGAILKDGVPAVENIYLNYNVYSDVFIAKENEHSEDKDASTIIKSPEFQIKIDKATYILGPHPENTQELQYFKLIITGKKMHLVKMTTKTYKPGISSPNGMTRDIPAAFLERETFYVVDVNKNYRAIPSSRSKFLEMFGDQQEKLKEAIKNGKLKLDNEADLSRLIRYYNIL